MPSRIACLTGIAALAFTGCVVQRIGSDGGVDLNVDSGPGGCAAGQTAACTCASGATGAEVCGLNGVYGTCSCTDAGNPLHDGGSHDGGPADSGPLPPYDAGQCVQESDQALCAANNYACGSGTWIDNCGNVRTVASCGTCGQEQSCSQSTWQCVSIPHDGGPHHTDAGQPSDGGESDGGSQGTRSCTGVADCVENLSPISVEGAVACESEGTTSAANTFTPVLLCAESCAGGADAGGCLNAVTQPGGMCASQWDACQADGVNCSAILQCLDNAMSINDEGNCVLMGNSTAIGLSQTFLACVQSFCAADGGHVTPACGQAAVQSGTCAMQYEACEAQ